MAFTLIDDSVPTPKKSGKFTLIDDSEGEDKLELAPEPSALDNGIAGFKKAFTDIGQGLG